MNWGVAYNEIHLAVIQEVDAANGSTVGNLNPHIRIIFMEAFEIVNQKIAADGIAGADTELSHKRCLRGKQFLPSDSIWIAGLTC